jgi:hypothetical protein
LLRAALVRRRLTCFLAGVVVFRAVAAEPLPALPVDFARVVLFFDVVLVLLALRLVRLVVRVLPPIVFLRISFIALLTTPVISVSMTPDMMFSERLVEGRRAMARDQSGADV